MIGGALLERVDKKYKKFCEYESGAVCRVYRNNCAFY